MQWTALWIGENLKTAVLVTAIAILLAPAALGEVRMVDERATEETRALLVNLIRVSRKAVLFGHQDDLAYGVQWSGQEGRSDVKEVTGSYPAVFGWDLGEIGGEANLDGVSFSQMRSWILRAYEMGAVNTISWHARNPVSGGDAWDTSRAVGRLLPGGSHHGSFMEKLDRIAEFVTSLKGEQGESIPVIFRPFHEHTGSWFWWGRAHCSTDEYVTLWRFTVRYLRDQRKVHNLIYAYSPGTVSSPEDYLERYPGDEWVDVLGLDDYDNVKSPDRIGNLARQLRMICQLANEREKVAALTETGLETIPIEDWWTSILLPALTSRVGQQGIAWVLVWRNARTNHHYAPFPGHPSAPDFVRFRKDPLIYFADDLPRLYQLPEDKN